MTYGYQATLSRRRKFAQTESILSGSGAALYIPYSRKLRRKTYANGFDEYNLLVLLESDPSIATYNECVPPVPISLSKGRADTDKPTALSVDRAGVVTVHLIPKDEKSLADGKVGEGGSPWEDWSEAQGFQFQRWTPSLLEKDPVLLSNLKILLRYVCRPDWVPRTLLEEAVLTRLREHRRITVGGLVSELFSQDRDSVEEVIATLILDRRVYSDINRIAFSQIIEVSAYEPLS